MTCAMIRKHVVIIFGVSVILFSLAVGAAAQSDAAKQTSQLAGLTDQLHIGAEFFLNRTETQESVQRHFHLMRENGLTLVRVFIDWSDIERAPGQWNFDGYDWIYDAATANGIKIVATLCADDPPGWVDKAALEHEQANLNDPEIRQHAAVYLEKVVNHYKNHPAQGVWLLMNEPHKYDTEPATLQAFGDWLQAKYGSVEELNKHWSRPLEKFSDVRVPDRQITAYWSDYRLLVDWREFNIANLVNILLWIKGQVVAIDPNHPTHINLNSPMGALEGQDVGEEKVTVDILGGSMHPAWNFPPTALEREYGELFAYRLDQIGSAAGDKPWWVTELQSGPTVYSALSQLTPTPGDMTRWLWDAFGAGSNAVIFWLWHPTPDGAEAGEWGLVSFAGKPTVRLPAVKAVVDGLKRNPYLASAKAQPAKVAILYNRESVIINSLNGRMQKRSNEAQDALVGCYDALHRAHIPIQFVNIDQLKQGLANGYSVLYIPYSYAIDDQGVAALREFVNQGGTLWADGLTGWKNEYGEIRPSIPGGSLSEVFGVQAFDIYSVRADQPYSITGQDERGGELWKLPLELKGAEVLLRDKEGDPFATRNHFGKGQVIYYESALTLGYFKRHNPTVQQWITEPAIKAQGDALVQMKRGSAGVCFRGLTHPSGPVAILSNWGNADTVEISFRGDYSVAETLTGMPVKVTHEGNRTVATIELPAGAVGVLKASKLTK